MKWTEKSKPKIGDKKTKTRFALFPRRIDNKNWVWMERYERIYEYKGVEKEIVTSILGTTRQQIFKEWVLITKNYIKK